MFSKSCEYTLKACIFVAQESLKGNNVSVATIAKAIHSPEAFVAKLLQPISKAGILLSSRGKFGGFSISSSKMMTPLIDIVVLSEGGDIFSRCALGLHQCSNDQPCPLHHSFKHIREELSQMMRTNTLYDMAKQLNAGEAFLKRDI